MTRSRDVATQGGLVLISSTSITAAATTIINNVFSAAYDNYCVVVTGTGTASGYEATQLQLRSGTTTVTSNYSSKIISTDRNVSSGTWQHGQGYATAFPLGYFGNAANGSATANIYRPFLSVPTLMTGQSVGTASGQLEVSSNTWGINSNAASYDQLVLSNTSGNFTGTVKVYGYK